MLSTSCLISLPRRRRWGDELERIQYRLSQKPGARKRNLKLNKIPLNYFTRNDRCNIMMHAGVSLNFFSLTIREMSKFDGCYVIPLKALSRGAHGLSINERQNLHQISKPCLKGTYICCFKVVIILLCILRNLFCGINLYRNISRSLSNKQFVWFFDDTQGKDFQRTRSPADVVFAHSIMERVSLGSKPAFRIFLRALRVAKRQFVYTVLLYK